MTSHIESPLLGHGEVRHPGVLHLAQPEVLDKGVNPTLPSSTNQRSEHNVIINQSQTLVSRPLVRVPGSRIREWNRMVCRTDMSQVKLMFLSTSDTLSSSLLGDTLKYLLKCII